MISELAVIPDAKAQFKAVFTQHGLLTNKQLEGVFPKVKAIEDEIMFPYTYTEPEKKPAARGGKKAPAKKKY